MSTGNIGVMTYNNSSQHTQWDSCCVPNHGKSNTLHHRTLSRFYTAVTEWLMAVDSDLYLAMSNVVISGGPNCKAKCLYPQGVKY